MTVRGEQICIGLVAAVDLSANQFQAVRVTADNTCNIASHSAVQRAIGILQDAPKSGRAARVAVVGESKAMAGAAMANVGVPISHNASGRVIAATSGLAVIGYNLEAAGADGDIVRILLMNGAALGQV